MSELEQLRNELNNLRERVAVLEHQRWQSPPGIGTPSMPNVLPYPMPPTFVPKSPWPPGTVTCGTEHSGTVGAGFSSNTGPEMRHRPQNL